MVRRIKVLPAQKLETGTKLGLRYSAKEPPDSLYPAFCFRYLDQKYGFPQQRPQRTAIINTLQKLGKMPWKQIKVAPRGGAGYEIIKELKKSSPIPLTQDAVVIAFRCSRNGRMIGYRDAKIFYVFWFDWAPFKVYDHS